MKYVEGMMVEALLGFVAGIVHFGIARLVVARGENIPTHSLAFNALACIAFAIILLGNVGQWPDTTVAIRLRRLLTCGIPFLLVMYGFSPL